MQNVFDENGLRSGDRVIYVGASFGAYIGFEILDRLQDFFSGAVMLDCGQNVGPGAGLKVRAGMWLLRFVSTYALTVSSLFTSRAPLNSGRAHHVAVSFGDL